MGRAINTTGSATLVVVSRSGRQSHGRVVKAGGDVVAVLRAYAETAAELVRTADGGRAYDPDQDQDDAPFLRVDARDLLDDTLMEQVGRGASLPLIEPDELAARPVALYALLLGDDPTSRTTFIRGASPVKLAKKGLVAVLDHTLTRVVNPILAFDPTFDVILSADGAWALHQKNFERLFRESDPVLARTGEWVQNLAAVLPIAEEGRELLAERLRTNSILRRKVQSVLRKPYLHTLTIEQLTARASEHGLDVGALVQNGVLVFTRETERDLLQLLNEDLFAGDFSGNQYAAGVKAVR